MESSTYRMNQNLLTRGILVVSLYTCLICNMIDLSTRRIEELFGVVPRNLQNNINAFIIKLLIFFSTSSYNKSFIWELYRKATKNLDTIVQKMRVPIKHTSNVESIVSVCPRSQFYQVLNLLKKFGLIYQ